MKPKRLLLAALLGASLTACAFFRPEPSAMTAEAEAVTHQCEMRIRWNPNTANIVDLAFAGEGCESTRTTAANWARALVICARVPSEPCRP